MRRGGANVTNNLLTDDLSEPLNGATTAQVDISAGTGNLTIDKLAGADQLLAKGKLQYFEKQGLPECECQNGRGQCKRRDWWRHDRQQYRHGQEWRGQCRRVRAEWVGGQDSRKQWAR
jgi:hypothetical protein